MSVELIQVSKITLVALLLASDAILFVALALRGLSSWRSKLTGAFLAACVLAILLIGNALGLSLVLTDVPGLSAVAATILAMLAAHALLFPPASHPRLATVVSVGLALFAVAYTDNGLAIAAAARGQPNTVALGIALAVPLLFIELAIAALLLSDFSWKRVVFIVLAVVIAVTSVLTEGVSVGATIAVVVLLAEAFGIPAFSWGASLFFAFLAAEAIYLLEPIRSTVGRIPMSQLAFQIAVTAVAFLLTLGLHYRAKSNQRLLDSGAVRSPAVGRQ